MKVATNDWILDEGKKSSSRIPDESKNDWKLGEGKKVRSLKLWKGKLMYLQIGIFIATEEGMPKHMYAIRSLVKSR